MGALKLTYWSETPTLKVVWNSLKDKENTCTGAYRFGFNGQEQTPELDASHTTALFWEYDARLGRRWNLDMVDKPWEISYLCFSGNPIFYIDPLGNNADDFYFDKDGNLLNYVVNDEPDRVFVLDEVNIDPDDPNMVPEPSYTQVEISPEDVKQKMETNGYREVTSKVEVTNYQTETSVSLGPFGSRTLITGTEHTVGIDEKYVKKEMIPIGVSDREYFDYDSEGIGIETYTFEHYIESVIYGYNKEGGGFLDWYIKIISSDGRTKTEENTKW